MRTGLKKYYFILGLIGALSSCVQVEPVVLEANPDASIYKPSDFKGIVLGDETLFDFRGGLGDWWWDKKYTILKQGSAMKVMVKGAGPNYEPFGINLDAMSFANAPVIKMRMKLDKKTTELPTLRLDLRDVNGKMTNGAPCSAVIKKSEDFVDYYFDYNHKWTQGWPEPSAVDETKIDGMQLFVNPGGKAYMGTILIDEITVMANKDGSGVVSQDIVIDNFESGGDASLWWPCKPEKVNVKMSDSALVVHFDDAQWDCFGKIFGETDVTVNPIIKVRAKAVSNTPVKVTNIMARFIDVNENATDLVDGENMMDLEVGGADYKDYYSVFRTKKEDNLYSSQGEFDPEKVNRVIIFINMNKETNFTGDVLVEEISFVKSLPKKIALERGNTKGPLPTMEKSWKSTKNDSKFEPTAWKAESKGLTANGKGASLLVDAKNAGPNWDHVSAKMAPFNIYGKQMLKIKAKASGNLDPLVRIDLVDNFGSESNARPVENVVKRGEDYQEYYFLYKNNFYQRHPEVKILNGMSIEGVKVYINAGVSKAFTGKVDISEISIVNIEDVPSTILEGLE